MAAQKEEIKRIAITGPESTGKSNLTRHLAKHYQTDYVDEYARTYIDGLSRPYVQQDILIIAQNQLRNEQQALVNCQNYLFCDTELIVAKVWSIHKYGHCDPWILDKIRTHTYDLFLLCNVDLPWEYDEQREHPHLRKYFFDKYEQELQQYGFPYAVVSGEGTQRLENAIHMIDHFLL